MIAEQLKRSILQAATQGKLTEQLPEDGDARDLFKEIQREKAHLIKEGKIKKEKLLPEISEDEFPFDIPENWCWTRLGEISKFIDYRGKTPEKTVSGVRLITAKNVKNGYISITPEEFINPNDYYDWMTRGIPNMGDILFTTEAPLGNTAIINLEERFALAQRIIVFQLIGAVVNKYFLYYLQSSELQKLLRAKSTGTTVLGIKASKLKEILVPLPPFIEQKRIIERLEEILPEIDKLKNDETKLNSLQKFFPKKMKDSILQAAIRGKLTEQLPEDGDARNLLKEIQNEKARLIKEGKIKKEKPLPEISEDEISFDLPENWCWTRLGEIFEIARGGSPRPIQAFLTTSNDGINWIKIGDTEIGGKYINETKEKIKPEGLKKSRFVNPGDLLLTNSMSFGRPYILNTKGCIHDGWLVLSPLSESICNEYFFYLLSSEFIHMAFANTVAGAVVKNLNSDKVRVISIPIPPFSEQKRIVQRLEELLPLCETLE